MGKRLKRQCFQLSLFPRTWLCPRFTAGEKPKQGQESSDRLLKRLLLLSDPNATPAIKGENLARGLSVVVAMLKACRVGLHGNSTQAGRKWPCAKRGSGCCQTGRGGWAVGVGGAL